MAQVTIDRTGGLKGVEVEGAFGGKTTYRPPERGMPVVDLPERHAKALLEAGTPGVSRYRGKSFNIQASWLPDKPLKLWRDDAEVVPQ